LGFAGYWFLEDADVGSRKWTPPNDLVAFIDNAHRDGHKVVYIGFGSIVVSDPVAMTESVVRAIEKSGVYAILSKGWSDRFQVKKGIKEEVGVNNITITRQIYEIASIPHDWLFARIDAACHHGGAGTTGASLRGTLMQPHPSIVGLTISSWHSYNHQAIFRGSILLG
jgi:sterol 3beta-glucosyltransferase